MAIEKDDNELLTLEIIHRYVELLDKYFGSVSNNLRTGLQKYILHVLYFAAVLLKVLCHR